MRQIYARYAMKTQIRSVFVRCGEARLRDCTVHRTLIVRDQDWDYMKGRACFPRQMAVFLESKTVGDLKPAGRLSGNRFAEERRAQIPNVGDIVHFVQDVNSIET